MMLVLTVIFRIKRRPIEISRRKRWKISRNKSRTSTRLKFANFSCNVCRTIPNKYDECYRQLLLMINDFGFYSQKPHFNAALVAALAKFKYTKAVPLIREAFYHDCVDEGTQSVSSFMKG